MVARAGDIDILDPAASVDPEGIHTLHELYNGLLGLDRNNRLFPDLAAAMAALREKKSEVARAQLTELVAEFPENPLFASELAKLKASHVAVVFPQSESPLCRMCHSTLRIWC